VPHEHETDKNQHAFENADNKNYDNEHAFENADNEVDEPKNKDENDNKNEHALEIADNTANQPEDKSKNETEEVDDNKQPQPASLAKEMNKKYGDQAENYSLRPRCPWDCNLQ
jgi:hypothetical protein